MSFLDLAGKRFLVFGVANKRSVAYRVARLLEEDVSERRVARIFEIKLLGFLGIMPNLETCVRCGTGSLGSSRFSMKLGGMLCAACSAEDAEGLPLLPGTVKVNLHIRDSSFKRVSRIKVSKRVGRELEHLMRRFLNYHIERHMKTLDFLRAVSAY